MIIIFVCVWRVAIIQFFILTPILRSSEMFNAAHQNSFLSLISENIDIFSELEANSNPTGLSIEIDNSVLPLSQRGQEPIERSLTKIDIKGTIESKT